MNIYTRLSNGYSEETLVNATRAEIKRIQVKLEKELQIIEQSLGI